jgi:hypothetical protein
MHAVPQQGRPRRRSLRLRVEDVVTYSITLLVSP